MKLHSLIHLLIVLSAGLPPSSAFVVSYDTTCAWSRGVAAPSSSHFQSNDSRINRDSNLAATTSTSGVLELLSLARQYGPVGIRQSPEIQELVASAARNLPPGERAPARIPLTGTHHLVYSAAPGGSSGKIGIWDGVVQQDFVSETKFINSVRLGPLRLALNAEREILSDDTIAVRFQTVQIELFGNQVIERDASGGGTWRYLYAGTVQEGAFTKFVRVLETPSLFVLEQKLERP